MEKSAAEESAEQSAEQRAEQEVGAERPNPPPAVKKHEVWGGRPEPAFTQVYLCNIISKVTVAPFASRLGIVSTV